MRRRKTESLYRGTRCDIIVYPRRWPLGNQSKVGGAQQSRYEVELDSRQERSTHVSIHEADALPAAHCPTHEARGEYVSSQRLVGHTRFAEARTPLDDFA